MADDKIMIPIEIPLSLAADKKAIDLVAQIKDLVLQLPSKEVAPKGWPRILLSAHKFNEIIKALKQRVAVKYEELERLLNKDASPLTARGTERIHRRKRTAKEAMSDPHVQIGGRVPSHLRDKFVEVVESLPNKTQSAALEEALLDYIEKNGFEAD